MLRKFWAFVLVAGLSGVAFAEDAVLQSVTSEVFYTNNDVVQEPVQEFKEPEYVEEYVEEEDFEEVADVADVEDAEPVWPIAGSEADVDISCGESGCGSTKIVTKVGADLVIENNIRTNGIGWSGGPNITNLAPVPAGFEYDCANNAEMPLMRREMMEDDGSVVLSVSRSPRTNCNKQADSYEVFAQRAGFKPEGTCSSNMKTDDTIAVQDTRQEIPVNQYVDAEAPANAQNQVRSWVVASGQTLRQVLQSWCDKEGWDLVWTSSREYPIEASAVFKGRFIDVASALIRNFERATPIPYAKFYKGNRVVVVSTNEE